MTMQNIILGILDKDCAKYTKEQLLEKKNKFKKIGIRNNFFYFFDEFGVPRLISRSDIKYLLSVENFKLCLKTPDEFLELYKDIL